MGYDRQALHDLIVSAITDVTEADMAAVDPDTDLFELGIDSLLFTTVLIEVEERLGDDIPAEAFDRFADLERFTLDSIVGALAGPIRPVPPSR